MGLFSGILGVVKDVVGAVGGGPLGALVSGGLGLLGQDATNKQQVALANETNAFNAEQAELNRQFQHGEAQNQMAFQADMASTAYQRATADMMKAGLNPMLAYQQGGAAVPSGAAGAGSSASGVMPVIGNKVAAGVNAALNTAQLANLDKQGANIEADTMLKGSQSQRELASAGQLDATRDSIRQEMQSFETRMKKLGWETRSAEFEAGIKNSEDFIRARMKDMDVGRAQVVQMMAQAAKYEQEARLLGLEVPEAVRRAAVFARDDGEILTKLRLISSPARDISSAFGLRR